MYLIRLDDAAEYMDVEKWCNVLSILDCYNACPLIGIIPKCEDKELIRQYEFNNDFWKLAKEWQQKGYIIAMHGLNHVYHKAKGGLNPINNRSEFVGLSLEEQRKKIKEALTIFKEKEIVPQVFFAPSHTFDKNTLKAISEESEIRIISDTIANNVYKRYDFFFLPCQMGRLRQLPLKFVCIALHPNEMKDNDFIHLKRFLELNKNNVVCCFEQLPLLERSFSLFDSILTHIYFSIRAMKKIIRTRLCK